MSSSFPRRRTTDDSDAYITVDRRVVVLDLPDDGCVAELLPSITDSMEAHNMTRQSTYRALAVAGLVAIAPLATTPSLAHAAAIEQKSTDDALKDHIAFRLDTHQTLRKYDVKVKVDGGVATLSGDVATAAQKTEAGSVAKIDGVSRVVNDITVDPDEDKTLADRMKGGFAKTGEKIDDAWITTKVKWFFTGDDALEGSNINVDTANNVVTLKGTVPNQASRRRANELAKATEGVKNVIDRLEIRATSR